MFEMETKRNASDRLAEVKTMNKNANYMAALKCMETESRKTEKNNGAHVHTRSNQWISSKTVSRVRTSLQQHQTLKQKAISSYMQA